ncbi:hypothetical protein VTH06DRAFT_5874 [Thermothelomyces fergusii]
MLVEMGGDNVLDVPTLSHQLRSIPAWRVVVSHPSFVSFSDKVSPRSGTIPQCIHPGLERLTTRSEKANDLTVW